MTNQHAMTSYLQQFIEGLVCSGVVQAVISPGSRSTPLALLLHRHTKIETFVDVDERSAAFFALGLSKVSVKPVVLLCTSGTAAANYYPAICEAYASEVPLIILTTDRPPELRQIGAPQAMDQVHLFQEHVKFFSDMALPESSKTMLDYAFWQGVRGTDTAMQVPKGPVHLNFPLREPLLPDLSLRVNPARSMTIVTGKQVLSEKQIDQCVSAWQGKRGVLIIGGNHSQEEARQFIQLAECLNWPIISDPLANIVASGCQSSLIMSHADLFIQEVIMEQLPEVIVRFGPLPLSKNTMLWLEQIQASGLSVYFIDEAGRWHEQLKQAQIVIQAEEQEFVQSICEQIEQKAPKAWADQWIDWQVQTEELIAQAEVLQQLNETAVSRLVHQTMKSDGQLFVSNSNAIRFLDRFTSVEPQGYHLYGNRGINGIDGIVSTALGMCAVHKNSQNILLIGDLALFHDMNGLWLAKHYSLPLTIVVLNNNGGGIFSYLSQRQLDQKDFDPLFGTPLDIEFSAAAELYGAVYQKVTDLQQLKTILEATQQQPTFQLIEVIGDRQENVDLYEQILVELREKLRGN